MYKIATIIALALSTNIVQAQTRYLQEGVDSYLYREGIATYSDNNGLVATSWFRFLDKNGVRETIDLIQVHCETQLFRVIRQIEYTNKKITYDSGENWSSNWENPIPNSLGQTFNQICHSR